jgi:hypothetical protein
MPSVFDRLLLQNPAETLFVALVATVTGVIILVVFILTRRALRTNIVHVSYRREAL